MFETVKIPCEIRSELASYPLSINCVHESVIVDPLGGGRGGLGPTPGLLVQQGAVAAMGEVLPPKRQAVVDRLRRRIENYRRRQTDCIPRFDQSFHGLCEQNLQETVVLKNRFLETKQKRAAKKTDKKQDNTSLQNNLHAVSSGYAITV